MKQVPSRHTDEPVDTSSPSAHDEILLQAVRQVRAGIERETNFRTMDAQLRARLRGFFRACHFSGEDIKDLVQKTLARVYLHIDQLEHEEKFVAWLFVIARNVLSTAVAEQQRESQWIAGGIELAAHLPDPDELLDQQLEQERLAAVEAAIDRLPAQQRQCLLLRVNEELSYGEIARLLRVSVNTVRNHLAEAKKNLRRALESQEMEGWRE